MNELSADIKLTSVSSNDVHLFITLQLFKQRWSNYVLIGISVKLIVCVEVLRPSQPNGVMSSAVSLPTFVTKLLLGRLSPLSG